MNHFKRVLAGILSLQLLVPAMPQEAQAQQSPYYDDEEQICWAEQSPETGLEARIFDAAGNHESYRPEDVPALLNDFIEAKGIHDEFLAAVVQSRILRAIFLEPGSPAYEAALEEIDIAMPRAPEAIYDLAKSLQLHWEARYALGVGQVRDSHTMTGTQVGAILGIAALGLSLFKRPQNTPKYFKFVKNFYRAARFAPAAPIVGTAVGAGSGYGIYRIRTALQRVPKSPAEVMSLGLDNTSVDFNNQRLYEDLISMAVGSAAISGTIWVMRGVKAVSWANKAGTVFKVHPAVLIGSIVIGLIVEEGVSRGVRAYQYSQLKKPILEARDQLVRGHRTGNDREVYSATDALVRSSLTLAAWLNQPITEALMEYESDVSESAEKYGEESGYFRYKLRERTTKLSDDIQEIIKDSGFRHDSDFEGYIVRGYLRERDLGSLRELNTVARRRGQAYLRIFDEWLEAFEDEYRISSSPSQRVELFHEYLDELDQSKDVQLSNELVRGSIRKQANHLLLQAAALIRSTNKVYVTPQSDFLMSVIGKNDLIGGAAMSGILVDMLTRGDR